MIEENAGRAVKLADYDPLGPVDNECSIIGHERQSAEIDFLFLYIANGSGVGFLVDIIYDKAHHYLDRGLVGHSPCKAFVDFVFHLAEAVLNELQGCRPAEILDGENGLEDLMEASFHPGFGRHILLQKKLIALLLHLDQVGYFHDFTDFSEILANPVFMG